MSLTTFNDLKNTVAGFLNRSDLTGQIPEFIAMAEALFNRRLRTQDMMRRSTHDLDERYTTLPSDWLELVNVQLNLTIPKRLQFVSIDEADDLRSRHSTASTPQWYTIIGDTIEVVPSPAEVVEIEITYYRKITPLSDSNTTNWLLTRHPDLYVYGALIHAATYLMDDERIPVWAGWMEKALEEIRAETEAATHSGDTLVARPRVVLG